MEEPKIERRFSSQELYTEEIQYHAPVFPLTGIHWQILNGWDVNTLLMGGAIGVVFTDGLTWLINLARAQPQDGAVAYRVLACVVAILLLLAISRFGNSKRRRLIRRINERLLSDREVGLNVD